MNYFGKFPVETLPTKGYLKMESIRLLCIWAPTTCQPLLMVAIHE